MSYDLDFGLLWEYRGAFAAGLKTTVALSLSAIASGTLLAVPVALAAIGRRPILRLFAGTFIHLVRAVPLLVLLMGVYYILPAVAGVRLASFTTAWIVFTVYLSAFVADVLRASILAVPLAYREAGWSIGMTASQVRRRIVAPEAIRRSLPALTALYLGLFKYSTLASVVSVNELLHTADLFVVQRLRPLEAYTAVALLFLVVVVPVGMLSRWLERRLSVEAQSEAFL